MTKRKNTKKKQKRKHSKNNNTNYRLLNMLLGIIIILILIIGFLIYKADTAKLKKANEISKQTIEKVEKKASKEIDKYIEKIEIKKDAFEEYTKDLYEEYIDKEIEEHQKEIAKTDKIPTTPTKKNDKKKDIKKVVKVKDKPKATVTNKPKLAIIIDDVTTSHQLKQIKNIGYTVTSSFLPPTKAHPHSAKIAQNLPFHMLHFPMQATTFKGEETDTLHIGDSYEKIERRVAQVRKWYPKVKYTNNHTGSKFTADYESMDRFFRALIKYDFVFMDSRTTSKTVAKELARKYKMPYIVRNVFLDNEQKYGYIQNQLKKAIKIAKKNGHAIAICHPHSITLKVLKESKHLLTDLELVYLNQIPYLNK